MVFVMEERVLLIYLHTIDRVGWKTIERIMTSLESLHLLFDFAPLELSMLSGIDLTNAERIIASFTKENIIQFQEKMIEWKRNGIQILTANDENYPRLLKEIAQPPWVLYSMGNLDLIHESSIAIVGTRNPTSYGVTVTEKLAKELTTYGWTVVSGMARGIDRVAHEATLESNGSTIAVLGCGIDIVYPKEHQRLYRRIINDGLIVSEYPPGTPPVPGFFPQRNRIISGLSYGTIVVEASLKSGSLITVQHALDQSREVFAVPGSITSKQSLGTNSLIQQGAKLIQTVDDVNQEFPYLNQTQKRSIRSESIKLTKNEEKVYSLVTDKIHIDEILSRSHLGLSDVYECLLSLQIKGKIKQIPGGYYRKNT
ncbi:DNA-processing protein DprA [Tepidibacillus fermentans]|uniref:DNA processing protein n=1 Tax=Tepidibacillus fermentans TaxID=1281767 RepID=A0A4R3KHI4_9BACI|nr:DNA-processing protein DprA [Tepidibacillus fermentans]TCS82925.1 DNA processing protein [Tepidibacillus fermentans]